MKDKSLLVMCSIGWYLKRRTQRKRIHVIASYICRAYRQEGKCQDEIVTGEEDCHGY